MPRLTRRDLLRATVVGAAGAAFGAVGGPLTPAAARAEPPRWVDPVARRRPGSLPFPRLPAGTHTMPQIEHVVVLMMENHSYDNYLGMLGRGDGFRIGRDGRPTATNPYPDGRIQHAFRMPTTCQLPTKPSQEWAASHQQYAGGSCDGFVRSPSGPVAMGYWTPEDLPFAASLAMTFPLADRWFASVLGQTFPNRRYLLAATSVGMVDDVLAQVATPAPNGTIFDRLNHYGIDWKDYYSTQPSADLFYADAQVNAAHLVPIGQFFDDAAAGTLPGFSIVDPDFTSQSEENPQDIVVGEAFSARVVSAVLASPAWPRTLLVWCYDEHGGYYDHVPPPAALPPDPIPPTPPPGEPVYDGFRRYGFRVPAVVVSPWARRHHVTSVVHDHTSILAMVERIWNLPAMTWRDANAADLTDFLDLRRPTFREPPRLAPAGESARTLACEQSGPGQIPPPGSISPAPHD